MTADEYVPTQKDNIGNLVVNSFVLIGILLAFAVVSGFALGGFGPCYAAAATAKSPTR